MIFKRAVARLRAQDCVAITIELAIVVIGVFLGTQVANWNADRLDRRQTQIMLMRLKPELHNILAIYAAARDYYALTRRYATTAFAGWQGDPKVSDEDFVIAAYQASQIYATATNNSTWATIFGADRLRTIDDPVIRDNLSFLMYADTRPISNQTMETPYRVNVRRVIPVEIQDAIRAKCGDIRPPNNPQLFSLPERCDLDLPPDAAATQTIQSPLFWLGNVCLPPIADIGEFYFTGSGTTVSWAFTICQHPARFTHVSVQMNLPRFGPFFVQVSLP